jgi:hypothetical protein
MLVASVMPAMPLPCAKAEEMAAKRNAAGRRILFFLITR